MAFCELRTRIDTVLADALSRTQEWHDSSPLRRVLEETRHRLERPLRVALTGRIKAGKSTLMNALLGQELVATGKVVTTFNVNWLTHGNTPKLWVHYKPEAGLPAEPHPLEMWETLTRRHADMPEKMRLIKYLQIRLPHEMLKIIELIDTPGLASLDQIDSDNTRRFMAMYGREMTESTRTETSEADANLYLFSKSVALDDAKFIEEMQDPAMARSSPLNTIGVFSQADTFWPAVTSEAVTDPMAEARKILANRQRQHPQLSRMFHAIVPVSALCAQGAANLSDEDADTILALSRFGQPEKNAPADRSKGRALDPLEYLVRNQPKFETQEVKDLPVSPVKRADLCNRLGRWGIWKACSLARNGTTKRAVLAAALIEASGMNELRRLVLSHFGSRAVLLKAHRACVQVSHAAFTDKKSNDPARSATAATIAGTFEQLHRTEHVFAELELLRRLYGTESVFNSEEKEEVIRFLGETGSDPHRRLNLPDSTDRAVLRAAALGRARHWHIRNGDALSGNQSYRQAARTLSVSYSLLAESLSETVDTR